MKNYKQDISKEEYAGFIQRSVAFAADYIIIGSYLAVLVAIGAAVNATLPAVTSTLFGGPISGEAMGFLLITLPVTLYFALSEASFRQASWGKQKKRLRVVDSNGSRLSYARAFERSILKFIPWELAHLCIWQVTFAGDTPSPVISAGFILVWFLVALNIVSMQISPTRQTLYDRLAGTLVVTGSFDRTTPVSDLDSSSGEISKDADRIPR